MAGPEIYLLANFTNLNLGIGITVKVKEVLQLYIKVKTLCQMNA